MLSRRHRSGAGERHRCRWAAGNGTSGTGRGPEAKKDDSSPEHPGEGQAITQGREVLRPAFLKDPGPVWRKGWAGARQARSTVFAGQWSDQEGTEKGHDGSKTPGHGDRWHVSEEGRLNSR